MVLDRLPIRGSCLFIFPFVEEGHSPSAYAAALFGAILMALSNSAIASASLPVGVQRLAKIIESVRIFRLNLQGFAKPGDGLVVFFFVKMAESALI